MVCLSSSHSADAVVWLSSLFAAAGKWLLPAGRPDLMEGRLQEDGEGKTIRRKNCKEEIQENERGEVSVGADEKRHQREKCLKKLHTKLIHR